MTIWSPELLTAGPRYQAVADALARDIAAGRLIPGDRLPTQRELAEQLGVSLGTVTRAYTLAETRGLIRGETGRGTFVGTPGPQLRDPTPPDQSGAVRMDVSWPLYDLDPDLGPALRDIASDPCAGSLLRYQPNAGTDSHRAAGAMWARRFDVNVPADRMIVCAGTQHAITVALTSVLEPGDVVFCEALTYPGFRALARLLKLKVIGIPMDSMGMVPDAFEAACRLRRGRALYTIPTLQNPTTSTLSQTRRADIAAIAKRHGVTIIEDAVHHLLADDPPAPIWTHAPDDTCFIASMSKVVTGGLRTAFMVVPESRIDVISQAVWATAWMSAPLCAEITARWIRDGSADAVVARKRIEAGTRAAIARHHLAGYDLTTAAGAYHAWLKLPDPWTPASFVVRARERGISISSADAFAVGPDTPACVRLSLSAPSSHDALRDGLDRLAALLRETPDTGCCIV